MVVQPIPNQLGSLPRPSGYVAIYPWRMPQNFAPQVANGGSFVPYQSVPLLPVNGNAIIHPWRMPLHLSPQVIDVDNNKAPQEQP